MNKPKKKERIKSIMIRVPVELAEQVTLMVNKYKLAQKIEKIKSHQS